MAEPNSKATLKDWCLRRLGAPVLDINVDDDQVDDRLDEALQYFFTFQYNGMERAYLKHVITTEDVARADTNETETVTDDADSGVSTEWKQGKGYLVIPDGVLSVLRVLPFSDRGNLNMFDVRYQLRLNDLYDFSSESIIQYQMTMMHLDFLDMILIGEIPIQYNVHANRLYLNMDWGQDMSLGEHLIIECYKKINPVTFTDIYNDLWLKKYATALIKRQWGENLLKFNGVQLLGGVTMNGEMIFNEAKDTIQRLEEESRTTWEEPLHFDIG